ncbi:hypothetical protein VPH35_105514 [Triticum aestivum]|uniref:Uncharacterized protein n=1 Tax=Triticum turgidum subsp. durum TaxID=4567 RepID=A0A9R1B1R9_TRITD|nr:unnamed protein product [Triticum turgidum subsp. durum]
MERNLPCHAAILVGGLSLLTPTPSSPPTHLSKAGNSSASETSDTGVSGSSALDLLCPMTLCQLRRSSWPVFHLQRSREAVKEEGMAEGRSLARNGEEKWRRRDAGERSGDGGGCVPEKG